MKWPKRFRLPKRFVRLLDAFRNYPRVELIAAYVGFVAVCLLLLIFFIPLPVRHPFATITTPLSVGSPEFLSALSGLTNTTIQKGSTPKILDNGDQFVPDVIDSINKAQVSINFTDYIWHDGVMSSELFDALTAAALRGVKVRILVDAQEAKLPHDKQAAFERAGGMVALFRSASLSTLTRLNKRTHRRAIIIDGRVGYLGGIAIDDGWLGDGRTQGKWRDMMFKVDGTMAESLQSAFVGSWYETTGEILAGDAYYPQNVSSSGTIPYINFVASPTDYSMPIEDLYVLSIHSAHKNIYIENPYFLPDKNIKEALIDAAKRGVDVRILMPASQFSPVHHAMEVNYSDFLEAGIKIYEYKTLMHTKVMTVDGLWSVIGSANLDNRSRAINNENDMGIVDPVLASGLEKEFMKDVTFTNEITLSEWKKRNVLLIIPEYLSFLFEKQY